MKRFVKSISAFLFAVVLMAVSVVPAFAETTSPYTYTIRLCTGSTEIKFDASKIASSSKVTVATDGSALVITGLNYGNYIGLEDVAKSLDMTDSKYYVKGIRLAGDDTIRGYNVSATGDADYVIAYGVKGDQIAYTVSYLDENGNKLMEDATYYGNAQDKAVVSCRYISGYLPDAYNKTFTLSSATDAVNHVDFTYHVDTNTIYNTYYGADTYEYGAAGVTIVEIPAAGGAGNAAAGNAAANAAGNAADNGGNAADNGAVINDDDTPLAPTDTVDLDEEDTPLASADEVMTNYAPLIAGIITGVAAVAILALLLVMKKNKIGPFAGKGTDAK